MRKVLYITYEFPPRGGPGVQRTVKFAKYLPACGWQPVILTIDDPPTGIIDAGLLDELPSDIVINRTYSLEPTRVVRRLRKLLGRGGGPNHGEAPQAISYTGLPPWVINVAKFFFIPDEKIGWRPWAVRAGLKLIKEEGIDVILSSGPPNTAHLIGAALAKKTGKPWVADFRDPWIGNYYTKPSSPLHGRVHASLERKVVSRASAVISVTPSLTEELAQRYPGRRLKFRTITNGFDGADFSRATPAPLSRKFWLTYTGSFRGEITPASLLKAVRALVAERSIDKRDFGIRFVGAAEASIVEEIRRAGLDDIVEVMGYVTHGESIEYLRQTTVAFLVLGGSEASKKILTGKIFEYLGSGKPILALVPPDGEAARVVNETKAGVVVAPDDISGIKEAVLKLYRDFKEHKLAGGAEAAAVSVYDRKNLTKDLAGLLDGLVGADSKKDKVASHELR